MLIGRILARRARTLATSMLPVRSARAQRAAKAEVIGRMPAQRRDVVGTQSPGESRQQPQLARPVDEGLQGVRRHQFAQ